MRHQFRGRPKKDNPKTDLGTTELQRKRAQYQTEELLDQLLRLKYITPQQHWCGNHFRWLYALRFGVATATSVNLTGLSSAVKPLSAKQQEDLTARYLNAQACLLQAGLLQITINTIIYSYDNAHLTNQPELDNLSQALDILVDLWG